MSNLSVNLSTVIAPWMRLRFWLNRSTNPSENRQYSLWWRLEGHNKIPINLLFTAHEQIEWHSALKDSSKGQACIPYTTPTVDMKEYKRLQSIEKMDKFNLVEYYKNMFII